MKVLGRRLVWWVGNTVAEIGHSEALGSCCALLSFICELRNESYELTVNSEICQVILEPGPQPKKLQEKQKQKNPPVTGPYSAIAEDLGCIFPEPVQFPVPTS